MSEPTAALERPPLDSPERPEGIDRRPGWPAWFAAGAFLAGMVATIVFVGIAAAVLGVGDSDDSAFVVIGTLVQGLVFVGVALAFASSVKRPRAWHFGLRRVPFWPALGWAAAGMLAFYFFAIVYGAIVSPDAEQGVTESLGAEDSTFGLIVAGIMVICVAPVVEEFFFRGFFYGALRSRFPILAAAAIDGLLFGVIHYNFEGADALLLLPPLAFLGFIFCLVYERTGSLFPVIGMHAFNNAVAYGVQADEGWRVSLIAGPLVLAACMLGPRLLARSPRPLPA